ncbi:Choline dehydrogenase [Actinobacteria bacterium OK074]|nr:Choline dehydrogenase [Actinobacteria bacterium OK074]
MTPVRDSAVSESWDDVIVGAGSCGAVVAARLAARKDRRVLLLEAGSDQPGHRTGQALGVPSLSGSNWDYSALLDGGSGSRSFPYRVGRTVGGSSAVNGAIALRGLPADFDGWAAAGNPVWSWDRVLPHFTAIEADGDMGGPDHGKDGPVPIRRPTPGEFDPVADGFVRACRDLGVPELPDLNAGDDVGVGPVPSNRLGTHRMSTADTHLRRADRPANLALWQHCEVARLLLSGRRVVGVEAVRDGRPCRVSADRVTLCAGAVNTPLVLQRSGIGDGRWLAALGIPAVVDLPGVGRNLTDHPAVAIWAEGRPGVSRPDSICHQVMARVASGPGRPDLLLFLAGNVPTEGIPVVGAVMAGKPAVVLSAVLGTPASRGTVRLRDTRSGTGPVIDLALATDPADVDRLVSGTRLAWSVARSGALSAQTRKAMLWTDRLVADDTLLRSAVTRFARPLWHPVGTARMGPPSDPSSVVDQYCRVHGLDGLWVVDASVMPSIPAAPTHLTCVMLAERAAEWIG